LKFFLLKVNLVIEEELTMAKPKMRSPKYPRLTLGKMINLATERLSMSAADKPLNQTQTAELLDYSETSGQFLAIVSSLRKYKILEEAGSKLKLSAWFLKLLSPTTSKAECFRLIEQSSYAPALFADILEEFGSQEPGDSEIRQYLIDRKFNPVSVDKIIKIYRANLNTLSAYKMEAEKEVRLNEESGAANSNSHQTAIPLSEDDTYSDEEIENFMSGGEKTFDDQITRRKSFQVNEQNQSNGSILHLQEKPLSFSLSDETEAEIFFSGPVTAIEITKLIDYLEMFKKSF
jgi:hypothetical protein